VRAYEDRTDLLRCLIIGPKNTPYEDAPFVIDWMLDSNFPHSPPIAHFLSWTNGNGRGTFAVGQPRFFVLKIMPTFFAVNP
jgi:ubiquitin-conjugating enzyme E2 O